MQEADEARRRAKEQGPDAENYGPGELSNLGKGALDDGAWESSLGDADSEAELGIVMLDGSVGASKGDDDDDDGPDLFFGGEDENPGGLIF